tara:strand:+ start:1757 stop:2251 length:495 start_codon:yes stop_codon:yes gene_type:complete
MKYRISDTDIINLDKVDFIELESRSIKFHVGSSEYQSFYNNDMEAMCVFNNINEHVSSKDIRFYKDAKPKTDAERKEKAFEMFWNLYDYRKDKVKTKKTFMNLTMNEMGKAINGVKDYVESTPDKNYRKFPRTWLNSKGWENEIKIDKKKTNRYVKPKYITDER